MASATNYTGFRRWGAQDCPTLKPGESYDSRATKFSQMGKSIITSTSSIRVQNPSYESVQRNSYGANIKPISATKFSTSSSDQNFNNNATNDESSNSAQPRVDDSKQVPGGLHFLGQSIYQCDFIFFKECNQQLQDFAMDVYEQAFHEFAHDEEMIPPNSAKHDISRKIIVQKVIPFDTIKQILQKVYGDMLSSRMIEIYQNMFDGCLYITWEIFSEAVTRVKNFLQNESNMKGSKFAKPAWMDFLGPKKILQNQTPSSSHQTDFGKHGDSPLDRPYMVRKGMASTTSDLNEGTTKATYHIPRYVGFIPEAKFNPIAVQQGLGSDSRRKREDIRLYHSNNVPGYAGHKPVDSSNVRGEAKTGTDPKTTNGYVYKAHI